MLTLIQLSSMASYAYQEKLAQLEDYMKEKKFPMPQQSAAREAFHLNFSNRLYFNEMEIMRLLPTQHVQYLQEFNARDVVSQVPVLSKNHPFARALVRFLEQIVLGPNQTIFEEYDTPDGMYFLARGTVRIISSSTNQNITILHPGCVSDLCTCCNDTGMFSQLVCSSLVKSRCYTVALEP